MTVRSNYPTICGADSIRSHPSIILPEMNSTLTTSFPTFVGKASPCAIVHIRLSDNVGNEFFNTAETADRQGFWRFIAPALLEDRQYTLQASSPGCSTAAAATFSIDTSEYSLRIDRFERGEAFRTVMLSVTAFGIPSTLTLYYLLLASDLAPPSESDILNRLEPPAESGFAARGILSIDINETALTYTFSLTGKENTLSATTEIGVMDGINYRLYLVAATDSRTSGVLTVSESAMGMPFASGDGTLDSPFFVRMCSPEEMALYPDLTEGNTGNRAGVTENARMLDNIEGMRVLYEKSCGLHGLCRSLELNYLFDEQFDLIRYENAYGGLGWRPIGNIDASAPGCCHIFTGTITTPPEGCRIVNLIMTPFPPVQGCVRNIGFFGAVSGTTLSGFQFLNASLTVYESASSNPAQSAQVGILVGRIENGRIQAVSIINGQIYLQSSFVGRNTAYVGGIAGAILLSGSVSDVQIEGILIAEISGNRAILQPVAGLVRPTGSQFRSTNVFVADAAISLVVPDTEGILPE